MKKNKEEKQKKSDLILFELKKINKNLKDKTLEVNIKEGITNSIYTGAYGTCFILIFVGIAKYYNWNYYISSGFVGLVLVTILIMVYESNKEQRILNVQ